MSTIRVNRIGDKISGSVNGVPFNVSYNDEKFAEMRRLSDRAAKAESVEELRYLVEEFKSLTRESYADFIETKSPYVKVNRNTNKFYLQYEGVISDRPMPEQLAQKMIRAIEREASILPLVKCWLRYLHNPKYTTEKAINFIRYIESDYVDQKQVNALVKTNGIAQSVAEEFSTTKQVAITIEGLIVGYKASNEITANISLKHLLPEGVHLEDTPMKLDEETGLMVYDNTKYDEYRIFEPPVQRSRGDAFYSGSYLGHIIRVGKIHYLPSWDMVDCTDNISGVKGLHIGGLNYIKGFQDNGSTTHNILVDPMHIGACVGLGVGYDGAMRVKQYFVLNAFNGVNKRLYHPSTYAQMTDGQYKDMIKNAAEGKFLEY